MMTINKLQKKWTYCLIVLITTMAMGVPKAISQENSLISLIYNEQLKPYQDIVKGFKSVLNNSNFKVSYVDNTDYSPIDNNSRLILALGSKAINLIPSKRDNFTVPPDIISTLTLNNNLLMNTPHLAGIAIQASAKTQLNWHKRILPDARRIGVLYDPENSQTLINELSKIAPTLGLTIIAAAVRSPTELTSALKLLGREADTILSIPDKTVYSGRTAKAILLFSYRNRIPFVGMSKSWVKAGAIYALDWDYVSLGQQCAQIAMAILDGKKANSIPLQYPTSEQYLLNLKTAKQLKVEFSNEIINGAIEVFQ